MSNTYTLIKISMAEGQEYLRYDMTHEKATRLFCTQYGFPRFNPGLKRNGVTIESYQTFHNWDNVKSSSSDSSSDSSPRRSSYYSDGDSLGGAVAEAVVTAPFKVIGWGWNSIKEGMEEAEIEAEKEKKEAFKAGGEKLAKWKEEQAKTEKTWSRIIRYGGGYFTLAFLGTVGLEVVAGPLAWVYFGYIGYRGYKHYQVKKEEAQAKKNRPPQVSHKYRTEAFK